MEKMKGLIMITLLCFVSIACYYYFNDYLPPRTPLKIARVRSGLNIPKSAEVVDFKEVYSFTGEGEIYVLFRLNEKKMEVLVDECKRENYKSLVAENLIKDKIIDSDGKVQKYTIHGRDIASIKNGYYRLEVENMQKMDFCISVLDIDKKELFVYVSLP